MKGECDSCKYETELKEYRMNRFFPKEDRKKRLCHLCAATYAGNAYEYPEQYPNASTLYAICYVGNVVLDAIKAKK